jgi:YfiH family protein
LVADIQYITPDWPAPARVRALTTTRAGGASVGPYASLNLGDHVGDDPDSVRRNRASLREACGLPAEPLWLRQVHGTAVVDAIKVVPGVEADGAYTDTAGVVLAVLTADCLPVFLCDRRGAKVALLHAGWRGLSAGVIENGVRAFDVPGNGLVAWLGPAIGSDSYEVGDEVRAVFLGNDPGAAGAFRESGPGRWHADLYMLARRRLSALGIHAVHGGGFCTYRDSARFYSFRREHQTGRMASLIWIDKG